MKRQAWTASLIVALLATGCESARTVSETQSAMSPEQRQAVNDTILQLNQRFFQAAANLDADSIVGMLAESPYSAFAGGGQIMYTRAAARESLMKGYSALRSQATTPGETKVVVLGPDAAVATGVAPFSATDTTGAVSDGLEIFTMVWVRGDAGWRIVQSHFSSRVTRTFSPDAKKKGGSTVTG